MAHHAPDLLPAEVEPFPLTADILHILFQLRIPTVGRIPTGLELQVRDAWIAEVQAVTQQPSDSESWVRLLLFWTCVLNTFQPTRAFERREATRNMYQRRQISHFLQVWRTPNGVYRLLSFLLSRDPSSAHGRHYSAASARSAQRSLRLARLGRYRDAVSCLSQLPPTTPSATSLAQLEALHPVAPSLPPLSPPASSAPEVSRAHILRALRSFPRGSAGGRDGMRPQFLLDMLRRTAAPIRNRTLDYIADLVALMIQGRLPAVLGPLLASASLVGIPKPSGGIRPIAVGLTLRRLAGKVALHLVRDVVTSHLQPLQQGVGVARGAEAIVHSVQRYVSHYAQSDNHMVAQVDLSNAFNRVSRHAVLAAVQDVCPSILPWVAYTLCCRSHLYFGSFLLSSSSGVQQGDPLGPMLFALAIHPLVRQLSSVPELDLSAWYLDDGTLAGSQQGVCSALHALHASGPQRGLVMNTGKTHLWWPNLALHPSVSLQLRGLDRALLRPPGDGVTVLGSPVSHLPSFYTSSLSSRVDSAITAIRSLAHLEDPQIQLLLLRSCLGSCRLVYLLRSIPPLPPLLDPLSRFDTALSDCLREDILMAAQYFGELQIRLSALPLSKGGLGITRATDIFSYAFLSSRFDTADLQTGLLASAPLITTDHTLDTALALAPPTIRTAYAQLAASNDTSVAPQLQASLLPGLTASGSCLRGPGRAWRGRDEDSAPATSHTQSLLAEQFFGASVSELLAAPEPPRLRPLLQCLQLRGTSDWLLAVPITGLQQTLDGRHFRALLRYRLCMQLFPPDSTCSSCSASMDSYGDHALLCRGDPSSAGFQLRHRLVQQTLGTILRQAGISHMVEPSHLRLQRDDSPESGRHSGLTRPADILLYSWRGDSHCCVDLVGVSPARSGWRDAASALSSVEQGKRDKHASTCRSHGFDFIPFGFSTFGSFGPEAEALLSRICQRFISHVQVPEWEAHDWVFRRLSFAVMRGVSEQLIGRQLADFSW